MAANSLRGGKNIYGPHCLQSNWAEERLEPENVEKAKLKATALPTKTATTWSKTSEGIGIEQKEAMSKKYMGTETTNWLKYQVDGPDRYHTTSGTAFCHPSDQKPPFAAPSIPDDILQEYRATWTKSDVEQFKQYGIGKAQDR
mmetsp:Transcript_67531/g.162118  ORF Transcript_67531/g.162118 Transcript_67531/m.162118 type:complete len:143 (-) Transcript_67531:220-648(-)